MEEMFFWKKWNKSYQAVYFVFFCVFLVAFASSIYNYSQGESNLVSWGTFQNSEGVTSSLDNFQKGLHDFKIEIESYVLTTQFEPVVSSVNINAAYLYLAILFFGAVLAICAISYMKKIVWFGITMTFYIAWVVLLRLDVHGVLGFGNQYFTFCVILGLIGLSYYFNAVNTNVKLAFRVLAFTVFYLVVGFIIHAVSGLNHPLLHLVNYGIILPLLITLLFILSVSYEIIRVFFFAVSSAKTTTPVQSLVNFGIISVLYLGNLVLMYLDQTGRIEWELVYLHPFILLFISTLLGFWGNKKRSGLFSSILSFHSGGAIFFLAMAIISTGSIAYTFASYNESMIQVLEDFIIFTHLGMGASFMVYIFVNFTTDMQNGQPVYSILYQPRIFPFYTVILNGLIVVFVMVSRANYLPVYRVAAAYYNFLGDSYSFDNEKLLAKISYERASFSDPGNLKSTLSAGVLYYEDKDYEKAAKLIESANRKKGTPASYALLANVYRYQNKPMADLFLLNKAIKAFPESGELLNNYGFCFYDTKGSDSSLFYFHKATQKLKKPYVSEANTYAFIASRGYQDLAEKVLEGQDYYPNNVTVQSNRLALLNMADYQGKGTFNPAFLKDTVLGSVETSYLNNALINLINTDRVSVLQQIQQYKSYQCNEDLKILLSFLEGTILMYDGEFIQAKEAFNTVIESTPTEYYPYYANYIGMLFTRFDRPKLALWYLERARNVQRLKTMNEAPFNLALVAGLCFDNQTKEYLNKAASKDFSFQERATLLNNLFNELPRETIVQLQDEDKYHHLRFMLPYLDVNSYLSTLSLIRNENIRAKAITFMLDYFLDRDMIQNAQQVWDLIPTENMDTYTINELNLRYLKLIERQYKFKELKERAVRLALNDHRKPYRNYYQGLAFAGMGDTVAAEPLIQQALKEIQINEDVYWGATQYKAYIKKDLQSAYDLTLEALEYYPESVPLLQAYVMIATDLYLDTFAEKALDDLQFLMDESSFDAFYGDFEVAREEAIIKFNQWEN